MNGSRRKWLHDIWKAFCIGNEKLRSNPILQKRLWKCMKKAYKPGMNANEIINGALKL